MFDNIALQAFKVSIAAAGGVGGIMLATNTPSENPQTEWAIQTIRELGSFGIIALACVCLIWLAYKCVPLAIRAGKDVCEAFLNELKNERIAREQSIRDFREMLASNKSEIGKHLEDIKTVIEHGAADTKRILEEGNRATEELSATIKSRPCQASNDIRK